MKDLTLHENEEIIEACRDFYAHLFREEPVDDVVVDEILTEVCFVHPQDNF